MIYYVPFSNRASVLKQGTCHCRRHRKDAIFGHGRCGGKGGLSKNRHTIRGGAVLCGGHLRGWASPGTAACEDAIFSPESPIGEARPHVPDEGGASGGTSGQGITSKSSMPSPVGEAGRGCPPWHVWSCGDDQLCPHVGPGAPRRGLRVSPSFARAAQLRARRRPGDAHQAAGLGAVSEHSPQPPRDTPQPLHVTTAAERPIGSRIFPNLRRWL